MLEACLADPCSPVYSCPNSLLCSFERRAVVITDEGTLLLRLSARSRTRGAAETAAVELTTLASVAAPCG